MFETVKYSQRYTKKWLPNTHFPATNVIKYIAFAIRKEYKLSKDSATWSQLVKESNG